MTFDLKAFKLQMTSIHSENWIFEFDLTKNEFFLPCWVDDCYKWGTTWENLCRGKGRSNFIGEYHIRLCHMVIGWYISKCKILFGVESHWTATLHMLNHIKVLHSYVCQPMTKWCSHMWYPPYRNLLWCRLHHFLEYPF